MNILPVADRGEIKFFLLVCLPSFIWFVISIIFWDYAQLVISFLLFLDAASGLDRCNVCHKQLKVDVKYLNYNHLPDFKIYIFGKLYVNYRDGHFPVVGFNVLRHAKIVKSQINETGYFVFYLLYLLNFIGVYITYLPMIWKTNYRKFWQFVKCNLMFEKEQLLASNYDNYIESIRYKYIWLTIDNVPKDGEPLYTDICNRCNICTNP